MSVSASSVFNKGSVKVIGSDNDVFQAEQQTKDPGFLESVWRGVKSLGSNIKNDFNERKLQAGEIKQRQSEGQGGASTLLQIGGVGAGFIGDVASEAVKSGVKAVLPQVAETKLKNAITTVMGNPVIVSSLDKYNEWKKQNPEQAANVESVLNIASLIPIGKGAQLAKEGAESGIEQVAKGAIKAGSTAKTVTTAIKDTAQAGVKDVGIKVADAITPIEKGVQTVLETGGKNKASLSVKFDKYVSQAEKAVSDYSQATPLELAGNEAEKALQTVSNKLQAAGKSKSQIAESLSSKPVGQIAADATQEFNNIIAERVGIRVGDKGKLLKVKGRVPTVSDSADLSLIKEAYGKLNALGENPSFRKVDDTIDYLQDLLFKRSSNTAIPVNSKVEGALKGVVSKLNNELQKIGGSAYQAANRNYGSIREVRDILNKALGVDANKGASLMKQLFSPSGTMPRKLFKNVKDLTGIDLVEEATLAKFAMENIGDVRQASLLEQVLRGQVSPTKSSLVGLAAEKLLNKIKKPVQKAKRVIESRDN